MPSLTPQTHTPASYGLTAPSQYTDPCPFSFLPAFFTSSSNDPLYFFFCTSCIFQIRGLFLLFFLIWISTTFVFFQCSSIPLSFLSVSLSLCICPFVFLSVSLFIYLFSLFSSPLSISSLSLPLPPFISLSPSLPLSPSILRATLCLSCSPTQPVPWQERIRAEELRGLTDRWEVRGEGGPGHLTGRQKPHSCPLTTFSRLVAPDGVGMGTPRWLIDSLPWLTE